LVRALAHTTNVDDGAAMQQAVERSGSHDSVAGVTVGYPFTNVGVN
jgi:hypothetical protein